MGLRVLTPAAATDLSGEFDTRPVGARGSGFDLGQTGRPAQWQATLAAQGLTRQRLLLGSLALPLDTPWARWRQPVPDVPAWRWRYAIERPVRMGLDGARWDLIWRLDAVGMGTHVHERRMTLGLSSSAMGWWPHAEDRLEIGLFHHRQSGTSWRHAGSPAEAARYAGISEPTRDWGVALGYGAQVTPAWYLGADVQWSARPGFALVSEERVSFGLRARWRF